MLLPPVPCKKKKKVHFQGSLKIYIKRSKMLVAADSAVHKDKLYLIRLHKERFTE